MKNQFNRIYIFCTFKGQLLLLLAFIMLNLFNVANYAYAEGSNTIGEAVGYYVKMQEDPAFIPKPITYIEKAYLLEEISKERAAFAGNPLPTKLIPLSTPEPQHSLPPVTLKEPISIQQFEVVPDKEEPLFVYHSTDVEGSNLKEILTDIQNGDLPVSKSHQRKFVHMLIELNKLEFKYKDAGMDQHEAMLRDVHKIFIDPRKATATSYPNIHNFDAPSNQKFYTFQEELQTVYFASKGNPLMLEAITVYNKNIAMYNRLLINLPVTEDLELTCYNDLYLKFTASYKRFTTILAEVENEKRK